MMEAAILWLLVSITDDYRIEGMITPLMIVTRKEECDRMAADWQARIGNRAAIRCLPYSPKEARLAK